MRHGLLANSVVALLLFATAAYGQTGRPTSEPSARSSYTAVGVAIGGIVTMNPDAGVLPFQWGVSVQHAVSRHVVIEGEMTQWSYTKDIGTSLTNYQINQSVQWRAVGVNVLMRMPRRTTAFYGGLGAGWYQYSRQDDGRVNGLPYSYGSTDSALGVHAVAGVDVRVAPRVVVFGLVRAQAVPTADLGTGGLHAGVRFVF